ncbi:hypothetical protein F3Y22_tig00110328pilonHSYRG00203 [Hibiscus syriacus]|uniref:Exocyst complex component Sec8 n=1 Tax=Hibiscus syriacus TaxID=106335 RepID=A0A6A3B1H5_HIBSY|nr:hypothetical protein F3Y22_tig00110328pilonHSYRG00203 [Hibiscus syriacus]
MKKKRRVKVDSVGYRDGSEDALTFAFRFTDATVSVPNQGVDLVLQGLNKKGHNVPQEGYGSAAVLPEQGIYLAASLYRPVHQFTDKLASMLPENYSQLGNDGLLAFMENFVKDRLLPTMFVDYRKSVQQAISSKFYNHMAATVQLHFGHGQIPVFHIIHPLRKVDLSYRGFRLLIS